MQFDPMIPIWLQVMEDLEVGIITGKHPPGSKLPGGRETAVQYGINPNTAARVYQELEKLGLSETRRGLGSFVTEDEALIARVREQLAGKAVDRCVRDLARLGVDRSAAIQMLLEREEKN